ncbi:MAG: hypothetical protein A3B37_02035 [Candidatus Sungbacteria bacterium RIFCSPLOWO2_01_FULL_59_16]|uniref:Uncharacterized protein n=1 Tax=Candidatus Sungbacteria bacterium RIFCSPLOWO2_01_FULL_59_16 TaxID=1802280 RepID=A0A1G2LCY2_9BACT|nr:MAG: hypothetical protein A3B37_02035 [Candidatus Sungbacteria bacterium RIFCSPLOWO2_01_FULL_59_16]
MEAQAQQENKESGRLVPISVLAAAFIIAVSVWAAFGSSREREAPAPTRGSAGERGAADLGEGEVLPSEGAELPAVWGNLGARMVSVGVIDAKKFESVYANRGGFDAEGRSLLYGSGNGNLKITSKNSGVLLNLLWALGLGNKNPILEQGPMRDPQYGGADRFASTGGWTLAAGEAMDHYSRHPLLVLTPEQQATVERAAKGIYRPCCNNPTHFPDCNHGMAMLGLLELMASQGVPEAEMYRAALQVNAYWFPDTYLAIAEYLESKGTSWSNADPKEILGYDYSSASGYRRILSEITPQERRGGGSCGI